MLFQEMPPLTAKYSKKERKAIKDASKARVKERRLSMKTDKSDVQPLVEAVFPRDLCAIPYKKSRLAQYTGRKPAPADWDYNKPYSLVPPPQD